MATDKPTSRRDFLRGRSVLRSLVEVAQTMADKAGAWSSTQPARSPAVHPAGADQCRAARRIMACEFSILYHAGDGPDAAAAAVGALDLIERLEDQLSIYRPYSEVAQVNAAADASPVQLEPRLYELLKLCRTLHEQTGGAFDVTGTPLSRAWGFLARSGRLPAPDELAAAQERVGFQLLQLDDARQSARFLRPGVEINFNAIGKGYALDRAAEYLATQSMDDYLLQGGGSSVLARGSDRSRAGGGWSVAVPHPLDASRGLGELTLADESLGTTGSGVQFFEAHGKRYGHVIDPRSGRPAEGVLTATVVAPTAAEADALSTAFYVMGPGGASEYCAEHPEIGAVLACPAVAGDDVDVHAFNLGPHTWNPAAAK